MCIYIGAEHGEDGGVLRHHYAVGYRPGALGEFPWGDALFDCVIFACDPGQARTFAEDIAHDIVACNVDWVQTTGVDAERLHDLIDVASVKRGRQNMVGDGNPMTAWDEEAVELAQMAEAACLCLGGTDYVLELVVGDEAHLNAVIQEMRRCLNTGGHEAM